MWGSTTFVPLIVARGVKKKYYANCPGHSLSFFDKHASSTQEQREATYKLEKSV